MLSSTAQVSSWSGSIIRGPHQWGRGIIHEIQYNEFHVHNNFTPIRSNWPTRARLEFSKPGFENSSLGFENYDDDDFCTSKALTVGQLTQLQLINYY